MMKEERFVIPAKVTSGTVMFKEAPDQVPLFRNIYIGNWSALSKQRILKVTVEEVDAGEVK